MQTRLRAIDLDPVETDEIEKVIGEAREQGGYLHIEIRQRIEEPVKMEHEDARVLYETARAQLPEDEIEELGDFDSWTSPDDAMHALVDCLTE